MTAASHPQIPLIDEFLQAMSADRGLARNSLDAYRRDLEAAASRLAAAGSAIDSCNAEDLRRVLASWHEDGLAPRSVCVEVMHGGFNHGPIKLLDVPENTTTAPPVLV